MFDRAARRVYMPMIRFDTHAWRQSSYGQGITTCGVCSENVRHQGIAAQLPCLHLCHPDCARDHLRTNDRCPVCDDDVYAAWETQVPTAMLHRLGYPGSAGHVEADAASAAAGSCPGLL